MDIKTRTMGLYGSGFTHDITALAIIIHIYRLRPILKTFAAAAKKFANMNIEFIKPRGH